MFVILGLRTKSFRSLIKRFSTIFETAVFVSTDEFCGKNFFISTGFWAKIFYLSSTKVREVFQNCILRVQGRKLRKIFVCSWKQKILFGLFFGFSPPNLSKNLLKLQSKCPKDLFQGKKLLETPQNCLSFLRLEANHFWIFGKTFSIKMSKLLFMCPNKRIVEKSLIISSKIWEKYSGILGKKRDLHSVLSKTALSVWRESLTETPSDFFSVFSKVSQLETSSAEKIFK